MSAEGTGGGGPPRLSRVGASTAAVQQRNDATVTAEAALAAGIAHAGSLSEDRPLRLWYLAAAAMAAGRLDLEAERGAFAVHFKKGVVEHAESDVPEDDIGRLLIVKGLVSAEALADALKVRQDLGGDLVAALAGLRLLDPAESFRILQEHRVAVLSRVLAIDAGRYRWTPGAPVPPSSFPLGSRWGVLCDAVRRLDGLSVRTLLGDRMHRAASRAGGRVQLSDLKLTAQEVRAAGLFDGTASPGRLARTRAAEAETLLRVALLLGETELLAFGRPDDHEEGAAPSPSPQATGDAERPPPAAPPGPAAAPAPSPTAQRAPRAPAGGGAGSEQPTPARPAAAPKPAPPRPSAPARAGGPAAAPKPSAPQDAAALKALHARMERADHFAVLGVKRDTPVAQIRSAYFQLARSYHPDAGPPGEPEELKKLRADLFARIGEAWGVVGDEARRAAYLQELDAGGPADIDVSAIFKAEETFQKATALERSRQYDKALEMVTQAIELNPEEPEFGVWKAWLEFLLAPDPRAQHRASAEAMQAALEKVPRCMPAYRFLGRMAKLCGDPALAERHLRRGLALDPGDAELARELKHLRK